MYKGGPYTKQSYIFTILIKTLLDTYRSNVEKKCLRASQSRLVESKMCSQRGRHFLLYCDQKKSLNHFSFAKTL